MLALPTTFPDSRKFDKELLVAIPLGCNGGSFDPLTPLFLPLLDDSCFF
jgi:hypothetical protein